MRVLALQANNAAEQHIRALSAMIERQGDTLVNWRETITDREFDILIVIPGEHNKYEMEEFWNSAGDSPGSEPDKIERTVEIDFGMGLTKMIRKTGRPTFVLGGCASPSRDSNYFTSDTIGPVFLKIDNPSMLTEYASGDFQQKFTCINFDEPLVHFYDHLKKYNTAEAVAPAFRENTSTHYPFPKMLLLLRKS